MTTDGFWKIIEAARANTEKGEADLGALKRSLEGLKAEDVLGFDRELRRRRVESYRWDLWAIAYIVNGGCSDDGFDYFRGWLISKGRKYFETALADPARAADAAEPDANECEDLLSIPASVYKDKTGRFPPKSDIPFWPIRPARLGKRMSWKSYIQSCGHDSQATVTVGELGSVLKMDLDRVGVATDLRPVGLWRLDQILQARRPQLRQLEFPANWAPLKESLRSALTCVRGK